MRKKGRLPKRAAAKRTILHGQDHAEKGRLPKQEHERARHGHGLSARWRQASTAADKVLQASAFVRVSWIPPATAPQIAFKACQQRGAAVAYPLQAERGNKQHLKEEREARMGHPPRQNIGNHGEMECKQHEAKGAVPATAPPIAA
jgi:hypothetical protein